MNKKSIVILTLTFAIGLGVTAYGAGMAQESNSRSAISQGIGFGRITGQTGYNFMLNLIKSKFGITDKDINDGISSGKTMYEIAEEKGITADEFKAAVVDEKTKVIDDAVKEGSITKEQGDVIKERIETNAASCTGFGQGRGAGRFGSCRGNSIGCQGYNNRGVNK